jgi:hypothetical protein
MSGNYKVKIKDIQNKYKFKIFCASNYDDSDLRKMIESVFYALPRTTGTGTSITLTDTAFSYLKNKLGATDTTQDTLTGANLINLATSTFVSWSYSNGHITSSPITTSSSGVNTFIGLSSNAFEVNANETIFIKFKARIVSGTGDFSGNINDSDNGYTSVLRPTLSSNYQDYVMKHKYNSSYNFTKVLIQFPNGACNNLVVEIKDFMISKSDIDYEPYCGGIPAPNPSYPMLIHTITGNNNLLVRDENLFNNNLPNDIKVVNCSKSYNDGEIVLTATGSDMRFGEVFNAGTSWISEYGELIPVKPNTKYSIKITNSLINKNFITYCNKEKVSVGTGNFFNQFATFTTPNDAKYVCFRIGYGSATNGTKYRFNIMLVEGEYTTQTIPDYKLYQKNAVLLTLGDIEICKTGNFEDKIYKAIKGNEIYDSLTTEEQATLDYGKWYLRKNIIKLIFNGTEYWTTRTTSGGLTLYELGVQGSNLYSTILEYIGLSNQYIETPYLTEDNTFRIQNGNVLAIHNDTIGSLENFENALQSNNLIVYYPLATPTNEKFNDTIQVQLEDIYNNMLSYEGQTNISQENADLPFNITSTAIKDLNDL